MTRSATFFPGIWTAPAAQPTTEDTRPAPVPRRAMPPLITDCATAAGETTLLHLLWPRPDLPEQDD